MPGSKPGERRGGRQKGTPNKAKAAKQAAAEAAFQTAAALISPDLIDRLTPAEYLDIVWKTLAKAGDIPGSVKIADMAAPFFNAKLMPRDPNAEKAETGIVVTGGLPENASDIGPASTLPNPLSE